MALKDMTAGWVGERVPPTTFAVALGRVLDPDTSDDWGGNATFGYPAKGGCGEPFRRFAKQIEGKVHMRVSVCGFEPRERMVGILHSVGVGGEIPYGHLISTMPIDRLVVGRQPEQEDLLTLAGENLRATSMRVMALAVEQPTDPTWHWSYHPGEDKAFHRACNLGAYSPNSLPDGDPSRYSAFLCEISGVWSVGVGRNCLRDLGVDGPAISQDTWHLPYAYPVPTHARDATLAVLHAALREMGVTSVGRFGGWKYEEGNMDHAFMAGYRAARKAMEELG